MYSTLQKIEWSVILKKLGNISVNKRDIDKIDYIFCERVS